MSDDHASRFLEYEIYPRLDRAEVFASLSPAEKSGGRLLCKCPECGYREAYIYQGGFRLRCGRKNLCGYSVHILQWLLGTQTTPRGLDFIKAVRLAAQMAGVHFEEKPKTQKELSEIAERQAREDLLEAFHRSCDTIELDSEPYNYLIGRGFTMGNIPVEFRVVGERAQAFLASCASAPLISGASPDKARSIARLWDGRIVCPVMDKVERIRALVGRGYGDTFIDAPKYVYTADYSVSSIGLIGLDKALESGNKSIVVFEGTWDIFRLRAEGISNVAATGGTLDRLTSDIFGMLFDYGVRRMVLFTDNDDAGRKGLLGALNNADSATKCPEIFVVNPDNMPAKDPDEIVNKFGVEEYSRLVNSATHAYRYRANLLSGGLDLQKDTERDSYLNSVIEYDAKFTDSRRIQKLAEFFFPEVERVSDCNMDALLEMRGEIRQAAIEKKKKKALSESIRDLGTSLATGDVGKCESILMESRQRLQDIARGAEESPIRTMADRVDELYDSWQKYLGQEIIGIDTGRKKLNQNLLGVRGFGILSARSGVGKTTELCGMTIGALTQSEDVCVVFYSLEMPHKVIGDRLACQVSGMTWRELNLYKTLHDQRLYARQELRRLGERLIIIDRAGDPTQNPERMLKQIAHAQEITGCSRVLVIIDYIDVLELDGDVQGNERLVEKQQIKVCLQIRDAIGVENSIIGVSEVRKGDKNRIDEPITPEDLAGSTRKNYSADWILIMNPLTPKEMVENFEYVEYVGVGGPPKFQHRGDSIRFESLDAKEQKEKLSQVSKMRTLAARQGNAFGKFSLVKTRDGGHRDEWLYTNRFEHSLILEGIH